MASRKARTSRRATRRLAERVPFRRWLAVGALGLVAFLYYRPLVDLVEARREVSRAQSEVRMLEARHARLERRLAAQTSTKALVREARRLGYVKPGERLFIVKGIPEWRQARRQGGTTIGGDG
jgi:cell division protein FtsB